MSKTENIMPRIIERKPRQCNLFFDKVTQESIITEMIISSYILAPMKARFLIASLLLLGSTQVFAASGDYKQVDCTLPVFTANGCAASASTQCFDGGSVTPGQKLIGLYDSWTNKNQSEQVIYQDEVTFPKLVNVGGAGTSWLTNPADEKSFWKIGSEIIFTPEATSGSGATKRNVFSLKAGKTVRVLESELGANYQLEKSTAKNGEYVGLVKFPVNYRDVDSGTGKPGVLVNHLECVAYKLAAQTVASAPVTPTKPTPSTPVPSQATAVKTGAADTFLFLGLAMLLALAFMFARKRKSL
jgi:LPXTG-motif cell wall-anchored protein